MELHTSVITLESFASLVENGVNHGVFIGESDSPVESTSTWETIIDDIIDMHSIPGNNAVPLDSLEELMRHVAGLQHAIDYFHTKMQTVRVFDREAWIKSNNGTFDQTNREDFYKEFKV